jgi:hypothetical protein
MTLGRSVASVVRANLRHDKGLSHLTTLTSVAGELSIQYYQDPDNTNDTEHEDNAFIAIPHFHPGSDRYHGQAASQPILKVIDLTWQLSLHVADVARKYLDEEHESNKSRKQQCGEILHRIEQQRADDPAMRTFMENFRRAKDALLKAMQRAKPATRTWYNENEEYRPLMNEQGRELIASLGQGEGEPGSEERRAQLERLWTQNIPDLHLSISHSTKNKVRWINEFITLQRGQYFFLQVIADYAEDDYVAALLERFRPEWAEDNSWLHDPKGRKKAFLDCGLWIHKRDPDVTIPRPQRQARPAQIGELPGLNIGINADGCSSIRWVRDDDIIISLLLQAPRSVIPQRPQDIRALAFTEYGIDIVDVSGQPFRYAESGRQLPPATIPSTVFARFNSGDDIYDMWAAVRRDQGHTVPPRIVASDDVWEGEKGVPAMGSSMSSKVDQQNRPPKLLDANWLLNKFLDERFPASGVFRTAPKSRRPDSTEDLQAFLSFLKSPAYHGHPYAEFWISCFPGGEASKSGWLSQNIVLLRRLRTEQFIHKDSRGGRQIAETFYFIGEPGTSGRAEAEVPGSDDEDAGLDGKAWGNKQGVPPVMSLANDAAEIPKQSRPPKRLDASWLLWTYLQERFPNGGTWMSTPLSINPNSTNEREDFLAFLRRPEYQGHPWNNFWVQNLQYTGANASYASRINIVMHNTLPYRTCLKQVSTSKVGEKQIRQTFLIIGAPGTGDPFNREAFDTEMQKRAKNKKRSAKSKKADAEAQKAVADADDDADDNDDDDANAPVESSKKSSGSSKKSSKSSKGGKKQSDLPDAPDGSTKTSRKSSKKGKKQSKDDEDASIVESTSSTKRTSGRATKRSILDVSEEDDDEDYGASSKKKAKRGRKRDTDDDDDDYNEEGSGEKDQKRKKRKRGPVADSEEEVDEEFQEISEPIRKKAKVRGSRRK